MVCWVNLESSEADLPFDSPNRTMGEPMRIDIPKQLVVFKDDKIIFDTPNNIEFTDTLSFYMIGGNIINSMVFLNGYNRPFINIKDITGNWTTQIMRYTVIGSGLQELNFDIKADASTSDKKCEFNLTTQGQTYKLDTTQKINSLLTKIFSR